MTFENSSVYQVYQVCINCISVSAREMTKHGWRKVLKEPDLKEKDFHELEEVFLQSLSEKLCLEATVILKNC